MFRSVNSTDALTSPSWWRGPQPSSWLPSCLQSSIPCFYRQPYFWNQKLVRSTLDRIVYSLYSITIRLYYGKTVMDLRHLYNRCAKEMNIVTWPFSTWFSARMSKFATACCVGHRDSLPNPTPNVQDTELWRRSELAALLRTGAHTQNAWRIWLHKFLSSVSSLSHLSDYILVIRSFLYIAGLKIDNEKESAAHQVWCYEFTINTRFSK